MSIDGKRVKISIATLVALVVLLILELKTAFFGSLWGRFYPCTDISQFEPFSPDAVIGCPAGYDILFIIIISLLIFANIIATMFFKVLSQRKETSKAKK